MFRQGSSIPPTLDSTTEARAPAQRSIPVPRKVLAAEARAVLPLLRCHWDGQLTSDQGPVHPGFVSFGEAHLPASTADDLAALLAVLVDEDHARVTLGRGHVRARTKEGRALLAELAAVARASSPKDVFPESAALVRDLGARHLGVLRPTEVAASLRAYGRFLAENRDLVDAFGGFDVSLLVKAESLASELAFAGSTEAKAREEALYKQRPLTARAVYELLRKIRHYAKYLFRDRPETYRQFTSLYLRRQRARQRRTEDE